MPVRDLKVENCLDELNRKWQDVCSCCDSCTSLMSSHCMRANLEQLTLS